MQSLEFSSYITALNDSSRLLKNADKNLQKILSSPIYCAISDTAPLLEQMHSALNANQNRTHSVSNRNNIDAHSAHLRPLELEATRWLHAKVPHTRDTLLEEIERFIQMSSEKEGNSIEKISILKNYVKFLLSNLQHATSGIDPENFLYYYDNFMRWSQYCIDSGNQLTYFSFLDWCANAYSDAPAEEWIMGQNGPYTCHRGMNERLLIDTGIIMQSLGESLIQRSKDYGLYGALLLKAYSNDNIKINILCLLALIDCYMQGNSWQLLPQAKDNSLAIVSNGELIDAESIYNYLSQTHDLQGIWMDYHYTLVSDASMRISSMRLRDSYKNLLYYVAAVLDSPKHFDEALAHLSQGDYHRMQQDYTHQAERTAERMIEHFLANTDYAQNKTMQVYHLTHKDQAKALLSWANQQARTYLRARIVDPYHAKDFIAVSLDQSTISRIYLLLSVEEFFALSADFITVLMIKNSKIIHGIIEIGVNATQKTIPIGRGLTSLLSLSLYYGDSDAITEALIDQLVENEEEKISDIYDDIEEIMKLENTRMLSYLLSKVSLTDEGLNYLLTKAGELKSTELAQVILSAMTTYPGPVLIEVLGAIDSAELYHYAVEKFEIPSEVFLHLITLPNDQNPQRIMEKFFQTGFLPSDKEKNQVIDKLVQSSNVSLLLLWNEKVPGAIFTKKDNNINLSMLHELASQPKKIYHDAFSSSFSRLLTALFSYLKSENKVQFLEGELNELKDGYTLLMKVITSPLHSNDKTDCAKILLKMGSNPDITNHENQTAEALLCSETSHRTPLKENPPSNKLLTLLRSVTPRVAGNTLFSQTKALTDSEISTPFALDEACHKSMKLSNEDLSEQDENSPFHGRFIP